MILTPVAESDYPAVVALANLAYRGGGAQASWNVEAGIIEGARLNEQQLREDLAAKPHAHLLLYRDSAKGRCWEQSGWNRSRTASGTSASSPSTPNCKTDS